MSKALNYNIEFQKYECIINCILVVVKVVVLKKCRIVCFLKSLLYKDLER